MTVRIVQHCFGADGSGGPIVAFERLLKKSKLQYGQIRQVSATGGFSIPLLRQFISELRSYGPELVHVRGLGNEGFHAALAARLAGVPNILVSIHGTQRDLTKPGNRLRQFIVVYVLEPLTLLMATHIATVCEFAARRPFLKHYQHKLVGVVPNGVDVPDVVVARSGDHRAHWGIPEDWTVGVCVSRITAEKGYLVLAHALARLDEHAHNFAVFIVGGGDERGEIRSHFKGLKNIKVLFVGHQNNVREFLTNSGFFIFPSLHENLSNALIEAMSYGLPVIATDVGGNTEVVGRGGGVLVPVGDSEALAGAIKRFLDDPGLLGQLGEEARENVFRHYSIQQMVTGWERIYARILGGDDDPV